MRSDLIDVTVTLHHETKPGFDDQGAILVSDDGNEKKAVWLPKSVVEFRKKTREIYEVTLPERLAIEKGLV